MNNKFDINTFTLNGNYVIDASAGTGKTYTITELVKKFVREGKDLKKMLIVTYTEKATGELRKRIRTEIEKEFKNNKRIIQDLDNLNIFTIHSFCQNAISEFGIYIHQPLNLNVIDEKSALGNFFDEYIREKNIIDNYVKFKGLKLESVKNLFINVILNFYFNKNYEIDENIIDFVFKKDLINYIIKLSENEFEPYDFEKNFSYSKLKTNIARLEEISNNLSNEENKKVEALFNIYIKFNYVIGKQIYFTKFNIPNDLKDSFNLFLASKRNFKGTNLDEILNDAESSIKGISKAYKDLHESDNYYCTFYAEYIKDFLLENKKLPTNKTIKLINFLGTINEDYKSEIISYLDEISKIINNDDKKNGEIYFLLCYIRDFYKKWQEEKVRRKAQTFNNMLRDVRENIFGENNEFKKKLQEKYELAIIDEFQDTNQLQFDIFKNIFMEDDKHHIIVVGDPKQSIYMFQGADLNVYKLAKEEIGKDGNNCYTLSTNYRSTAKMIDSCNKFFANQIDENGEENPYFEKSQINFVSSESPSNNYRVATFDDKTINAFMIGDCTPANDEAPSCEEIFAKIAVKKIIDFCSYNKDKTRLQITKKDENEIVESKDVRFSDITILYRTRSESNAIASELRKCGIPYVKYKDPGLFLSNECKHWITILEAIECEDFTGKNRNLFKKALFTNFFNKTLEEINSDYFNHDDNKEMQTILKWKGFVSERKWEDLIDSILEDSNILTRLNELDKLQSIMIFKQIGNYCISYLFNNHDLSELIVELKNLSNKNGDDDEDSGIVEIGTDFNAVKMMTIHASKGLQFPIVISVAGFKDKYTKAKTYLMHNDNKERKIVFKSPEADNDTKEEFERLMYVAYTRAEFILVAPHYKCGGLYDEILSKKTQLYKVNNPNDYDNLTINDYKLNYKDLKNQVQKILNKVSDKDKNDNTTKDDQLLKIKEVKNKNYLCSSYKHSYSQLSHGVHEDEELDEDDRNLEGDKTPGLSKYDLLGKQILSNVDTSKDAITVPDNFPKGSKIGEALHEVFEDLNYVTRDNLEEIIKNCLEKQKILAREERISYIKEMVDNVLNANLDAIKGANKLDETFKLSSIENKDKKCEAEFNYNKENEKFRNYFNGFIDLIFRRGDVYSVLDWKSDSLKEDDFVSYCDNESLKKHTDDLYSIQRVLYSYTLIKWLKDTKYKELSEEEIFNNHFGGIYYVYLRGCNKDTTNGVYQHTWSSYNDLKKSYDEVMKLA